MSHNIEVGLDIDLQANLAFWIDKDEWEAMTDEQKKQTILYHIDTVNYRLQADVLHFNTANISAIIMEPGDDPSSINLENIQVYDPKE